MAIAHRKNWPANQRVDWAKKQRRASKKMLALLLPAHNEELIIATTIRSAIASGQKREDIFVVDDNSSDNTRKEALRMLPKRNVLSVERSGKAMALLKAIRHFEIEKRYTWVHVADADSIFGNDYFKIYRQALRSKNAKEYVAAVGFVQSLRGNWISRYRTFSYTYGQQVIRRLQSWLNMISVFPGPVTSFRTSVINKLDFDTGSLTEDFDLTLQVHRQRLGKIKFIPGAVNFTQDPQNFTDFCKQTSRWHRGFFQGIRRYRIGTKVQAIDMYMGFQLLETLLYVVQIGILLPFIVITTGKWQIVPAVILADYIVITIVAIFTAFASKRPSLLLNVPSFYVLRMVELGIFIKAFIEVIIFRRFRIKLASWDTEGRRYQLNQSALRDTAQ